MSWYEDMWAKAAMPGMTAKSGVPTANVGAEDQMRILQQMKMAEMLRQQGATPLPQGSGMVRNGGGGQWAAPDQAYSTFGESLGKLGSSLAGGWMEKNANDEAKAYAEKLRANRADSIKTLLGMEGTPEQQAVYGTATPDNPLYPNTSQDAQQTSPQPSLAPIDGTTPMPNFNQPQPTQQGQALGSMLNQPINGIGQDGQAVQQQTPNITGGVTPQDYAKALQPKQPTTQDIVTPYQPAKAGASDAEKVLFMIGSEDPAMQAAGYKLLEQQPTLKAQMLEHQAAREQRKYERDQDLINSVAAAQRLAEDKKQAAEQSQSLQMAIANMGDARSRELADQMSADRRFAVSESNKGANKPPTGYRWLPDGNLEQIPGGPVSEKQQKAQEKIDTGKEKSGQLLDELEVNIDILDKNKGIGSPDRSAASNAASWLQNTGLGQTGGKIFATDNQRARNNIQNIATNLLLQLKNATGLSATQMNSNMEMQTYLKGVAGGADYDAKTMKDIAKRSRTLLIGGSENKGTGNTNRKEVRRVPLKNGNIGVEYADGTREEIAK